ncbi:hypothetical protein ACF8GG_05695 [Pseudomonas sp. yb_1]|jgi:hypothetical protein|uniref:hypothetical protein n=1 Tax=Pseudomonas TaxID=286 RepID=UPI000B170443
MYKLKRNESTDTYPYRWLNRDNFEENILMKLLRVFLAMLFFAGILAGSVALLLLVLLIVRFPPLLIAMLLACWVFCRLVNTLAPSGADSSAPSN